ncbi:hypothetical protein ACVWWO_005207 [Bradyrhizobium sp. F1.13.1]
MAFTRAVRRPAPAPPSERRFTCTSGRGAPPPYSPRMRSRGRRGGSSAASARGGTRRRSRSAPPSGQRERSRAPRIDEEAEDSKYSWIARAPRGSSAARATRAATCSSPLGFRPNPPEPGSAAAPGLGSVVHWLNNGAPRRRGAPLFSQWKERFCRPMHSPRLRNDNSERPRFLSGDRDRSELPDPFFLGLSNSERSFNLREETIPNGGLQSHGSDDERRGRVSPQRKRT